MAGLVADPGDELVADEPDLPPAGEPVRRDAVLPDHLAEVLDVHLEELGRLRGGEDRRDALDPGNLARCGHGGHRSAP